jgi:hypothetical protein
MKKVIILFVSVLLSASKVSFAQTGTKLTCTVDDGSFFDTVEFYSDKKVGLTSLSNRFFNVLDLFIYPDSYLLSGDYEKGLGTIRYSINRSTGRFEKVTFFKATQATLISTGYCKKIENKF